MVVITRPGYRHNTAGDFPSLNRGLPPVIIKVTEDHDETPSDQWE